MSGSSFGTPTRFFMLGHTDINHHISKTGENIKREFLIETNSITTTTPATAPRII
jgi:hypothetical protein